MAPYVVIDACVAGAWLFAETFSSRTQPVFAAIDSHRVTAIVPDRFAEEVLRICQKKTLPPPQGASVSAYDAWDRFLEVVTSPVVMLPCEELHEDAWRLAFALGLTSHDALYLALAEQWDAELWTLDDQLAGAARAGYGRIHDLTSQAFPY